MKDTNSLEMYKGYFAVNIKRKEKAFQGSCLINECSPRHQQHTHTAVLRTLPHVSVEGTLLKMRLWSYLQKSILKPLQVTVTCKGSPQLDI